MGGRPGPAVRRPGADPGRVSGRACGSAARKKLLEHQPLQNVEVDVTAGTFQYLRDFDLGDKVDVIVQDIGLAMEARVVSVREVFKANDHTISVTLGIKNLPHCRKRG